MQLSSIPEIDSGHIAALARYHWPGNIRELRNVLERSLILWEGGRFNLALPSAIETQENVAPMLFKEDSRNLEDIVNDAITLACKQALTRTGGNKTEAAEMLGISRGAFYRYLKRVGIGSADRTQDRAQSRHGKPGLDRGNRVREKCVTESRTDSG
jgi:DNA-binding NtrC family response regulator